MSLFTASRVIGGIKEYIYHGMQHLPIVLTTTSLVFTVATGSMAHLNLALGMGFLMPIYAFLCQLITGFLFKKFLPDSIFWKTTDSDVCRIIPGMKGEQKTLQYYLKDDNAGGSVPSYWITAIGFFIGYTMSNAVDSLQTPAAVGSSDINHEKRTTQAIHIISAICIFSVLIIGLRLRYMSGCEGLGTGGNVLSVIFAAGAAGIGYGMYNFSKSCGAKSSDLLGILSQILPAEATRPHPVVCTAN
jgi:hypothetical protein